MTYSLTLSRPDVGLHTEIEGSDTTPVQEAPTPIVFPLPPMTDVIGSQYVACPPVFPKFLLTPWIAGPAVKCRHQLPRTALASAMVLPSPRPLTKTPSMTFFPCFTLPQRANVASSERIPLLQHAAPHTRGKGPPNRGKTAHIMATFASGPITSELAATHTLHTLGWAEYVLPDSSFYYHHVGLRVTTDIDLRNPRHLQQVTEYVEKKLPRDTSMPPPQGWELWLKSGTVQHNNFRPNQSWVNHKLRIITAEPPPTISGEGLIIERYSEDDSK